MSETALNFGPEWVRALSHGGSVSSPPSSPGPIKFKLADYRYGREEMLALFSKDFQSPDGLENLGSLCIEQTQEPLAFLPMNIEEQRIWQRCVNSEAVLRSVGRVPPNGIGRGRGGSVDRGRGRGRGGAPNYYGRGVGYDDDAEYRVMAREGGPPGMSSRTKGYERSQSMTDARNWPPSERSAVAPEERLNAVSSLKGRSATGNWRARGENEEESDRWRGLSHSRSETKWGGNRGVWRDGEWDESRGHAPVGGRGSRPPWDSEREREGGYRRHWEDDNLPEWAIDSPDEKGGTFDATGAFHAPGSSDEDDQEETNGDLGIPSSSSRNGPENGLGEEVNCNPGTNGQANEMEWEDMKNEGKGIGKSSVGEKSPLNIDPNPSSIASSVPLLNGVVMCEGTNSLPVTQSNHDSEFNKPQNHLLRSSSPPKSQNQPSVSPMLHYIRPEDKAFPSEEDKLLHMQSVADDLVAKLVEDVEDSTPLPEQSQVQQPPAGFIAASNATSSQLPEDQWYYTDPQGDIQGPFAAVDMAAWYKAGYFKPNLLLRRQCDDKFAQLGDLTRAFGRVPFLPGPAVPPLKVSELLNAQKVEAERQRYEMMQAQLLQKQLYQQQNTLRQQQVLQSLQNMEEWRTFTPAQQQQLFMHHIMSLPPLPPPALPNAKGLTTPSLGVNNPPPPSLPGVQEVVLPSPTLPPKQDPIQAFVAQMSAAGSSGHVMMPDPVVVPTHSQTPAAPPSTSASLGGGGDGPLQKLLLQLQRGPQPPPGETVPVPPTSHQAPPVGLSLEKAPDQQMDAIQSIMNQLSKIQGSSTTGEVEKQDDQRQRELEQKRIEEERRKFEEQRKAEELRLQKERLKDEKMRKELELENEKLVEELKRIQADQAKKRKQDEATKKKDASKVSSGEANRKEEEQRRQQLRQKQQEEEKKKQVEEERRKKEEARKAKEEEKKREEQRIKADGEQQKRKEKEREREKQMKIQEEMRKTALEEERRRMQQLEKEERKRMKQEEQAKKKANSGQTNGKGSNAQTPWATSQVQPEKVGAPSLIEIQKAQEIKSKKEKEAEAQREVQRQKEAQRIAAEEKKQKEMSSWVNLCSGSSSNTKKRSQGGSSTPQIKSLVEIQKEEARELKQRLEKEQAERAAAVSHLSLNAAGVWGAAAQSLSWANRASSSTISNAPPSAQGPNSAPHGTSWNNGTGGQWSAVAQPSETSSTLNSGGFWDSPDLPKTAGKASSGARSPHKGGTPPSTATAPLPNNPQQAVNSNSFNNNSSSNKSKKTKEDTGTNRASSANAEFRLWCKTSLSSIRATASIDVPTFIGFLSDVESPYDVHDYIRSYLGDSKEVKEFARQYLERRSRARNALKEARMDDNILAPAPAVNPVASGPSLEFQEVKTRLKKGKKKMQKVDNSILGFSLNSVEKSGDSEE